MINLKYSNRNSYRIHIEILKLFRRTSEVHIVVQILFAIITVESLDFY